MTFFNDLGSFQNVDFPFIDVFLVLLKIMYIFLYHSSWQLKSRYLNCIIFSSLCEKNNEQIHFNKQNKNVLFFGIHF